MSNPLPVPHPDTTAGGIYSVGYNAWKGHDGLSRMFEALESEGVTIVVDTRNSDYRAKHSFEQLAKETSQHQGINGQPMRYAHRPVLTGKPKGIEEYNEAGQADYAVMDNRAEVGATLDGMVAAAHKGERIALLCACADVCSCHRTRWLGESLEKRGVDVGHIEPGTFDYDRYTEAGERELYSITPHSSLPDLPDHSDKNWAQQAAYWRDRAKPKPVPQDYASPQATRAISTEPTQILIAGSMNANHAQLNYASSLVVRAAEVGAQIHVGDNDQGVDARVVETANSIGYENVVVWTAGDDPRNGGVAGGQIRKVPHNPHDPRGGNPYTQRDRTMIDSLNDEQGVAFFLDNGFTHRKNGSLTGTEAGYTFAVERGKAARKVSFGKQQDRDAELKPLPTNYTPKQMPDIPSEPHEPPPPASKPVASANRYPTLHEFEESLRQQRRGIPEPEQAPDPMIGYSIQAVQTVDSEGQSLGHSAVALRDVYQSGIPVESDISTSYALELARFAERDDAEQYAGALTEYIKGKAGLEFIGSAEHTAGTGVFLNKVAEGNGLAVGAQLVERYSIVKGRYFQAGAIVDFSDSFNGTISSNDLGFC